MEQNQLPITLNGDPAMVDPGTTAGALLQRLELVPAHVVVEVDGEIVPRERLAETPLPAGAVVEIVHFVGGG